MTDLTEIFFVGKSLNVRITDVDPTSEKIVASVRQALPTALAAEKLEVGQAVSGIASQIHAEQVVVTLEPSQITALLSLSSLSNHRHMGVDDLRASLKTGDKLEDLVVISKNATSGLVIVANKRIIKTVSGISTSAKSFDTVQRGQIVPGRVISHIPQGTMVQLPNSLRGRVHPCDASDDLSVIAAGKGPLNVDDSIMCYVLKSNPSTRIIDLSTRQSRTQPDKASEVLDKEIDNISDLTEGQAVRGLVKNVSNHGVFVALGRAVTARIMIKELFDDVSFSRRRSGDMLICGQYVKDWQSRFEVNQLVSGKILK